MPFVDALDLSEAQLEALHDSLDPPDQPPPRPDPSALQRFAADDFSADELGLDQTIPAHVRGRAQHMIDAVTALLPLLDEDQVLTLLDLLESGPKRRK